MKNYMQKLLEKVFGDPNAKVLAGLQKEVDRINALEPQTASLTDEALKEKTIELRERLAKGADHVSVLFEAFALTREAAKRQMNQRHFDVQLIGGLVLARRGIAEMRTGEGKTLTSTAPLYYHALKGKGCHLVTVNDYLAMRDAVWMGQIFAALGMSVGCVTNGGAFIYDALYRHANDAEMADGDRDQKGSFLVDMDYLRPVSRREAYAADITYGTNNEFGFDFLRDNMAPTNDQRVQRELYFCIIDEVDSILIDEARTPLIISAPAEASNDRYVQFARVVKTLSENTEYNVDEKMRTATFTEAGIAKMEQGLGIENLYAAEDPTIPHHAEAALRAHALFDRDVHYVVRDGEVMIVDEFTGRLMPGRRFSQGLHQAIEAKEGVEVKRESQTLATITFQNLFRQYEILAGMTGTAATESEEFSKIYNLDVTVIPTHLPIARKDLPDRIYKSKLGKYQATIEDIKQRSQAGQPVLVGTTSIEQNELLGSLLTRAGVSFALLNAKNHTQEAQIIAQAGRPGAVTIATNMAGRGVDIVLGGNPVNRELQEQVKAAGGLHVIGTERHESRRIDNQLRGRSGRQGDPGSTQFYLSMEDDLMRIFGSDRVRGMMDKLGIPDDMPIENKLVTGSIEKAQVRVEGHHFDARKHLLDYDDVLNKHREVIYARRQDVLDAYDKTQAEEANESELKQTILSLVEEEIEQVVLFHTGASESEQKNAEKTDTDPNEIVEVVGTIIPLLDEQKKQIASLGVQATQEKMETATQRTVLIEAIMKIVREAYEAIEKRFEDKKELNNIERGVMVRAIDLLWIDHLAAMTGLRTGIGLRGYGQRDPLVEYKKEAYDMFQQLLSGISREIVYTFFKQAHHMATQQSGLDVLNRSLLERAGVRLMGAAKTLGNDQTSMAASDANESSVTKAGRNEPCPCGSGKKYKKCHGV